MIITVSLIQTSYLNTRVYGTYEEDVGKDYEDSDVDSQHDRGAVKQKKIDTHQDDIFIQNIDGTV